MFFDGKNTIVLEFCKAYKEKNQTIIRAAYQPAFSEQVDWKEEMKLISKYAEVIQSNTLL